MHRLGEPASSVTAGNIMQRYPEIVGHLKLTTVLTLISRLISKNYIRAEKVGRAYCYLPLINEDEYKQTAAKDFVRTVFKGDTLGLISLLVREEYLGDSEKKELKRLLES